ncbi:HNH endonuclease [Tardiphaga sp. 285_C5_N1_2]|uniref:HNH endonuclease n=1 Tax=Tardiphaga sp. 285_C5_N1_2 TaxID=3240775 RepID=UPI003F8A0E3B
MAYRERLSARQRGYTHKWDKAAAAFKLANPLCVMCEKRGLVTPVYAVDHIIPHKGDMTLFWDQNNWQSLCRPHHNNDKQHIERNGYQRGVDIDGRPLDPSHPWNREGGARPKI